MHVYYIFLEDNNFLLKYSENQFSVFFFLMLQGRSIFLAEVNLYLKQIQKEILL